MKINIKHFYIVLILFITVFFNSFCPAGCAELYKIKSVNFDISNSLIFIPIKTTTISILTNDLKNTELDGVNGVELELINSSIADMPDNYSFSEGYLKGVTIEKDTKKNSTKFKLTFNDKYNLSNLKISTINGNLIITFAPLSPYNMNYYLNTYRENESSKDYKENLVITTKSVDSEQMIPVSNKTDNNSMSEIHKAFQNSNYQNGEIYTNLKVEEITQNTRLRSKYYLFGAAPKDNTFKITGVGTVAIQKPFLLANPQRMVFDIPNSTINPDLHGKELTLDNGDIIRMAQFKPDTTRLVVTSEKAPQYMPVFQPDSQGLIIANPQNLLTTHLPSYKTNIVKFNFQKSNLQNNLFFEFDKPVMYGIKRTTESLYIYFLNAEKYNDSQFHSVIKNNIFSNTTMHLLSTGIRVKVPVENKENLNVYISPDGKLFKISAEIPKAVIEQKNAQKVKELKKKEGTINPAPKYTANNHNIVVIDAGHGGKDYGALRGDINEKTITLDVSKMVQSILQKKGYKVYMTRTDDTYVSLEDRVNYSEGINPTVFVSIHVNSCNSDSPKGIETHYYNENSIELADTVHKSLIKRINTNNRGLFKSRFYVINHTTAPSILVEIGFISNPTERQELTTLQRQQATAEGIADGIVEFIKGLK